jgi:carbon storage regulator
MLVLSRKTGESVIIGGKIVVKIMRVEGEVVKLGIQAPLEVPVHRQEVYEEIQRNNKEALTRERIAAPKLSPMPLSKTEVEKRPSQKTAHCDTEVINKNT